MRLSGIHIHLRLGRTDKPFSYPSRRSPKKFLEEFSKTDRPYLVTDTSSFGSPGRTGHRRETRTRALRDTDGESENLLNNSERRVPDIAKRESCNLQTCHLARSRIAATPPPPPPPVFSACACARTRGKTTHAASQRMKEQSPSMSISADV